LTWCNSKGSGGENAGALPRMLSRCWSTSAATAERARCRSGRTTV
jgi:hypothetical protein